MSFIESQLIKTFPSDISLSSFWRHRSRSSASGWRWLRSLPETDMNQLMAELLAEDDVRQWSVAETSSNTKIQWDGPWRFFKCQQFLRIQCIGDIQTHPGHEWRNVGYVNRTHDKNGSLVLPEPHPSFLDGGCRLWEKRLTKLIIIIH